MDDLHINEMKVRCRGFLNKITFMKPILYRFSINGHRVNPFYKDDLSKQYEMESNQHFFREKLSGKLSFLGADYKWLDSQDFETEFILLMEESFDGGISWKQYFQGSFMKTDCKWDEDNMKCEVTPDVKDDYNAVLAGLDKEYNLIELAPEIESLTIKKRPMIQIYAPGEKTVSNVIGGSYFEQDVTEPVSDEKQLVQKYFFSEAGRKPRLQVTGGEGYYQGFNGDYYGNYKGTMKQVEGLGVFQYFEKSTVYEYEPELVMKRENGYKLFRKALQGEWLFKQSILRKESEPHYKDYKDIPSEFKMDMVAGGISPTPLTVYKKDMVVYMRYLTDVEKIRDVNTYPLPDPDIVDNNRNYKRAVGFKIDLFRQGITTQKEPTQWGRAANGEYFVKPGNNYYPVARTTWNTASYWFYNDGFYTDVFEDDGTKEYILKDSYPVSSCINVLLQKIAPGITHEATPEFSEFFYGTHNPITGQKFTLLVTPKTNVLVGEYRTPALKAITTLREFLDMLKNCYRCYWYIEDKKLKIEHIKYFRDGGTYTGVPEVGTDLTVIENVQNKKKWGYSTSNYEFDKADMPERFQFAWMDEVTDSFDGMPIEIQSKYVTPGRIEDITVKSFTTDIDYMLLNPSAISKDGFALFSADIIDGAYSLPIIEREIAGNRLKMQNGYISWITLQPNYYIYDLPASKALVNGNLYRGLPTSRNKKQRVKFPTVQDINTKKLVKTYLGNGQIEKISVNLSSRMNDVTLRYDTE